MAASGKLVYNPYAMRYHYLWKAPKSVKGLATLTLTFADDTSQWIEVSLR